MGVIKEISQSETMTLVCSEVGEDYFLQGIGTDVFGDDGQDEPGDDSDNC